MSEVTCPSCSCVFECPCCHKKPPDDANQFHLPLGDGSIFSAAELGLDPEDDDAYISVQQFSGRRGHF